MRTLRLAALVVLVVAGAGLWPATAARAKTDQAAKIVDFDYAPNSLTVAVDTTVTWTNTGGRPHTVTDRGGAFDTNPVLPGKTGSVTFSVPGTYAIFCRINPSKMNGLVTVTAAPTPSPVVRVQATDEARDNAAKAFDPATLSVSAGTAVLFANIGGKPHTLTADDGSFDTGVVTPGAEGGRFAGNNATITLEKPGTFPFHCEVHPAVMKGVFTVTGEAKKGAGAAAGAAQSAAVAVKDFAFDPPEISVAPGGKVTWKNNGAAPHTATFDDVQLDTGNIAPGASGVLTAPDKPGSYSYRCNIHPAKMRGVLVVVGQNTADPTRTAKVAAAPIAATGKAGPGGAVSGFVIAVAVLGSFLGGFGVSAFLRRRPAV